MRFNTSVLFSTIPIGGQFVVALTVCDEVVTRIEPTTHKDKSVNGRRVGGKLVFIADWEPVFADGHASSCWWDVPLPTGYPNYWHCDCGFSDREVESGF